MIDSQSGILQHHLDRLRAGDRSARDDLLTHTYQNLRRLVSKMLGDYPGLRRWEDADDIGNNAAFRLWKALDAVAPATSRDFYRFASLQIRRELLDLARHHSGPQSMAANHESVAPTGDTSRIGYEQGDRTYDPARLAQWTEFHSQVEHLPEEEREVFDLLFYQDVPHAEAAEILGISEATLRRRWLAARLHLQQLLRQDMPS